MNIEYAVRGGRIEYLEAWIDVYDRAIEQGADHADAASLADRVCVYGPPEGLGVRVRR